MVLCDGLGTWTLEADAMTKSVLLFFPASTTIAMLSFPQVYCI